MEIISGFLNILLLVWAKGIFFEKDDTDKD